MEWYSLASEKVYMMKKAYRRISSYAITARKFVFTLRKSQF